MEKGTLYKLTKLEKGPLQRFKNQNLLLKKFGETGLLVYRSISSKKTSADLKSDLELSEDQIFEIISYMEEAGMIEATSTKVDVKPKEEIISESAEDEISANVQTQKSQPKTNSPDEESVLKKPKEKPKKDMFEDFITPIEDSNEKEKELVAEEKETVEEKEEVSDEVESIEEPPQEPVSKKKVVQEEKKPTVDFMFEDTEEKDIAPSTEDISSTEDEDISPVERIIKDKYGSVGIKVYTLIDGERTAEEIMKETGLTDTKLIEILDFMDTQGIIKLDYPTKNKAKESVKNPFEKQQPPATQQKESSGGEGGFAPILSNHEDLENVRTDISPIEVPVKVPIDIVKEVSLKARVILKFGDKGAKILEMIDGKKDVIDLGLVFEAGLPGVYDVLKFLVDNRIIILKPMNRDDVKKKYGDEGFAVYKRFGKEGVMLYELIGKDMSIKQIADRVSRNKEGTIDIFLFVREILGVEVPMDKDNMRRELGI